jgi:hypothetical protein
MSQTHDRHPDEEEFHLVVEVPGDVRHDPIQLREWLEAMAVDLANSESVDIEESRDQAGASDTDWVQVTLLVRPCGGRFPADDDDQGEDDDGPGDDFDGVVQS